MFKTTPQEEWYHRLQQTDRVMTAAEFAAWRGALMAEPRPIQIATFIGQSNVAMTAAIERARREMGEWYRLQRLTHLSDGGSLFQFSTAAYVADDNYTFIITVFDTRYAD